MKTSGRLFRNIAAICLVTFASCSKELETEVTPVETQEGVSQVKTYAMAITAGRHLASTRALSLDSILPHGLYLGRGLVVLVVYFNE